MKALQMIQCGALRTSLSPWKSMPKAHKTPKDYVISVNGADLKGDQVMLTGGGAHPAYTYIQHDGSIKWFAGHFATGTAVEIIDPTPVATPAPAQAEQPKAEVPVEQPKAEQPKKSNKK